MPTPSISWLIIVLVALSLVEEASHSSVEDSPLDDDNTSSIIHPANMFILLGAAYYFITITMPSSSSIIWRLPLIWLTILHALCFWLVLSLVRAWCYWSKLSKKKRKKFWAKVKKKPKAKMKAAEDSSSLFSRMRRMLMLGGRRRNGNCNHGLDMNEMGMACVPFVQKWLQGYNEAIDKVGNMEVSFKITQAHTNEDADAVWGSSESIDWLVSYFLMTATKQYLNGNIDMAGVDASYADFFNQHKAVVLDKTKPKIDWHEVVRIHNADRPTLAAFLRERIPCTCLD